MVDKSVVQSSTWTVKICTQKPQKCMILHTEYISYQECILGCVPPASVATTRCQYWGSPSGGGDFPSGGGSTFLLVYRQTPVKLLLITSFGRNYTYIETLWKEVKWSMKWPYSMQLNQSRNVLFQTHLLWPYMVYWTLDGSGWHHNYPGYTTSLYLVMKIQFAIVPKGKHRSNQTFGFFLTGWHGRRSRRWVCTSPHWYYSTQTWRQMNPTSPSTTQPCSG